MKPNTANQTFTQDSPTMQIIPIITKIVFIYYLFIVFICKGTAFFSNKLVTIKKKYDGMIVLNSLFLYWYIYAGFPSFVKLFRHSFFSLSYHRKKGDFPKPPNSKNGISFYIILFINKILFNKVATNFISQYKLSQKLSI